MAISSFFRLYVTILIWRVSVLATETATHAPTNPHHNEAPTAQQGPPTGSGTCGINCGCPGVTSLLQVMGFTPSCISSSLAICTNMEANTQFNADFEELRQTIYSIKDALTDLKTFKDIPRNCKDLQKSGDTGYGLRKVYPYPGRPLDSATVFCDHRVDGGGWTVFQHRTNSTPRENFERTFTEYTLGFGNLEGEFWLGLELLHALTSWNLQELRVELADYEGEKRYAKYGLFHVGPASDKFRLSVGGYSGDAGDALSEGGHNGQRFSTPDADHDAHESNCAKNYRGGWWYAACHLSNLNGYQHEGQHEAYAQGINWQRWKGYHYSLMKTTLMIRPAF